MTKHAGITIFDAFIGRTVVMPTFILDNFAIIFLLIDCARKNDIADAHLNFGESCTRPPWITVGAYHTFLRILREPFSLMHR